LVIALRANTRLIDRVVKIEVGLSRRRFPDLIPDPVDDLSGSIGSAYDTAELFLDLAQAGRLMIQVIHSGVRAVARGSNRLGDFVRQRGGLFSNDPTTLTSDLWIQQ
jgi:hypothetical protein